MKKRFKKLVVLGMVVAMAVSSTLCVSAAGLRDVFNAKYYADSYPDLKAAFGDNEEALYKHFIDYGLKENRQMNPIIDIQAYRKAYPDLEAAFGENWDAYVNHFFAYGAYEGRTQGVLFNPIKYAEAYPDVAAAYGTDIQAITNHYLTRGIAEGRTAGVTVAAPASAASGGGSSSSSSSGSSGTSTPSTPTTPDEPSTPEEQPITVQVYTDVTCDPHIKELGTAVEVKATKQGGVYEGALDEQHAVVVSTKNKVGGAYWYAIAVPKTAWTGEGEPVMWFNNGSWQKANDNPIAGVANVPDDYYVVGLGDDGTGGSAKIALTADDVTDVDNDENAVKFDIDIKFKRPTIKVYNQVSSSSDDTSKVASYSSGEDWTATAGDGSEDAPYTFGDKSVQLLQDSKVGTTYWYIVDPGVGEISSLAVNGATDVEKNKYFVDDLENRNNIFGLGDDGTGGETKVKITVDDGKDIWYSLNATAINTSQENSEATEETKEE